MPTAWRARLLRGLILSSLSACRARAEQDGCAAPAAAESAQVERLDLALDEPNGLSGLATDGTGAVWAVSERDRMLIRVGQGGAQRLVRVDDVPENTDLEALAWLQGARFAIGTESMLPERSADLVLVVEIAGAHARIVERIPIPYAELPIKPQPNRGIEGLCYADGHLLAAFEQVVGAGMNRRAVVVERDQRGALRVLEVALTTQTGKLSALECRRTGQALNVIAVERHFGVQRVIRFDVPLEGSVTSLDSRLMVSLEGRIPRGLNPEGVVWLDAGLLLVVDNDYGGRTGPNELLRVPLEAAR